MRLVLLALLFVLAFGQTPAPTTADLRVLDLYPIVWGFSATPDHGDQRMWIESKTISIDFDMLPENGIPEDHLWEAYVYAEKPVWGAPACEYSLSYVRNGNPYVIRHGGWGHEGVADYATWFHYSSSVLWVRGSEVPEDATELQIRVENCYLARYVTRMQFDAWNGQAYLLDFSTSQYVRSSAANAIARLATWESSMFGPGSQNVYTIPVSRDNTITQPGSGYWAGYFALDYSAFGYIDNPVLELWFYKPTADTGSLEFYFCNYNFNDVAPPGTPNPSCTQQTDYLTYTNSAVSYSSTSGNVETNFIRVFFDIEASRLDGDGNDAFGVDPYQTLVIYQDRYDAATAPYARIWDKDNLQPGASPQLWDLNGDGSLIGSNCVTTTDYSSENLIYDGVGFNVVACSYDTSGGSQAVLTYGLPASVTKLENPFMMWYEWSEQPDTVRVSYEISLDGNLVHLTDLRPGYTNELTGWDLQIALGSDGETFSTDQSLTVTAKPNAMFFNAFVPVHSGFLDSCGALPTPCSGNGACYNYYWDYVCICKDGWMGKDCAESVDDCHDHSCLNGGVCEDDDEVPNGYKCACPQNPTTMVPIWTGKRCEALVNECPQAACLNGGTCVTGVAGKFTCECVGTFVGKFCEHDSNNCNLDPFACKNEGLCVDDAEGNGYSCDCSGTGGFEGDWCEIAPECAAMDPPCQNGGWCSVVDEDGPTAVCTCPANWYGDLCEVPYADYIKDCRYAVEDCMNGGECTENTDGEFPIWRCDCTGTDSYTGVFCEVAPGCEVPCMNDGVCQFVDGRAQCTCSGNWFGDYCQDTLKEALLDCRNAGECVNGACNDVNEDPEALAMYRCECEPGWMGDWCEESEECQDYCMNGGHCAFVNEVPLCTCPGTYFGDRCEVHLEDHMLDCRANGGCMNAGVCNDNAVEGEFRCVCDNLLWEGVRCELSLKCEDYCQNGGKCALNESNEPYCMCTSNWFGDVCDQSISDLEMDCRFGTCENDAVCNNNGPDGLWRCVCEQGWTGTWCEVSEMCADNPCQNNGACYVANGAVQCNCPGSFFGDFCQDTLSDFAKDCRFAGDCQNGGNCNDNLNAGEFRCVCSAGFTGTFCEESTLCSINPCENGGSCYVVGGKANCLCPGNYFGVLCQNSLADHFGDCGQPCQNGGTCVNVVGKGYQCACDPNYTGQYCDTPVVCHGVNNPCMNDGVCHRGADGKAICVCPGTFVGATCQWDLMDFFKQNFELLSVDCRFGAPCQNDGVCTLGVNGAYSCKCTPGFFGDACEVPAGCSPNPCGAHGRCSVDGDGHVICLCPAGTIGANCEHELADFIKPDCRFQRCQNDGSCTAVNDVYSCNCPQGWGGAWCEVPSACDPNPCMNAGVCYVTEDGAAACTCAGDHFGPTCEEENLQPRVAAIEDAVAHLERINNVPKNN